MGMIDTIPVYPLGYWITNDYRREGNSQPLVRINWKRRGCKKPSKDAPSYQHIPRAPGSRLSIVELAVHFGCGPLEALRKALALGLEQTTDMRKRADRYVKTVVFVLPGEET